RRPSEIVSATLERPSPNGLFVAPATRRAEKLSILDPRDRSAPARRPARYREVARHGAWVLWGGCRPRA
ncbi:MAG: hypothetical protein QOJ14_1819, partial [Thermoleophilaceae bacterium]|nr:hypothetical protein [Thermoleophilaceae bacterium]